MLDERMTLGHQGLLIDLGGELAALRFRGDFGPSVEREGATWGKLLGTSFSLGFVWTEKEAQGTPPRANAPGIPSPVFVQARVRGLKDGRATIVLNGKVVGTWPILRDETRVVVAQGGYASIVRGMNELSVRMNGTAKEDGSLLLDWIHIGTEAIDEQYAAPTPRDAMVQASVGGRAKRALSLRTSSFARFVDWLAPGTRVRASVAMNGVGGAKVSLVRLVDGESPNVLYEETLNDADQKQWRDVDVVARTKEEAPTLGALEWQIRAAKKGVRVLIGDPRIEWGVQWVDQNHQPPRGTDVERIAIVVLSRMPTNVTQIPEVSSEVVALYDWLTSRGTYFSDLRSTSVREQGAFASILTGCSPLVHSVDRTYARLPKNIPTIADTARQAGISTALFSTLPTTSAAYGFSRGWDHVASMPVTAGGNPAEIFDSLMKWTDAHKGSRWLAVVHARAGHPPWHISEATLKTLGPTDMSGGMDPRKAGIAIAASKKNPKRISESDKPRMWAAYNVSLAEHGKKLREWVESLERADTLAKTAIFVTSDVGIQPPDLLPLTQADVLNEDLLRVPLFAIGAGAPAGTQSRASVTSSDVAVTTLEILGLTPPITAKGQDFTRVWSDAQSSTTTRRGFARVAADSGRLSLRAGAFVLLDSPSSDSKLCQLTIDPTCTVEARTAYPIAFEWLAMAALRERKQAIRDRAPSEDVFLDPTLVEQLHAWGVSTNSDRTAPK